MKNLRVFWDAEKGWTVETPFALSPPQLVAVVNWVKKVQKTRLVGKRGDAYEQAAKALNNLTLSTLHQSIIARPFQEAVLFERK